MSDPKDPCARVAAFGAESKPTEKSFSTHKFCRSHHRTSAADPEIATVHGAEGSDTLRGTVSKCFCRRHAANSWLNSPEDKFGPRFCDPNG